MNLTQIPNMRMIAMSIKQKIKLWIESEDGIAAAEFGLIFPILLVMLLGTFDLGNGILAAQKTIRASQVTADLITRSRTVNDTDINEAIDAGELALQPFPTDEYGVDIISIRFNEDAEPEIVWQVTQGNITAITDLSDATPLAEANSGVVMVTTNYTFEPAFGDFLFGDIEMQERAFSRGRRSAVVNRE